MEQPKSKLKGYALSISIVGMLGRLSKDYYLRCLFNINDELDSLKESLKKMFALIMTKVDATTFDYTFEIAPRTGKVHLHGMFASHKYFTYKSLQVKGWNVYIRELRSEAEEQNWFWYINKDQYLFDNDIDMNTPNDVVLSPEELSQDELILERCYTCTGYLDKGEKRGNFCIHCMDKKEYR